MVGRRFGTLAIVIACSLNNFGVLGGPVQSPVLVLPPEAATYRQNTINVFNTSWQAYKFVLQRCSGGTNTEAGLYMAEHTHSATMT